MKPKSRLSHVCAFTITVVSLSHSVAHAWTTKTDLVSPSSCRTVSKHLVECAIAPRTLSGTVTETAVPLRTRVQTVVSGTCSTQYPLEVTLSVPGESPVRYFYLRESETTLRRRNGQPIASFALKDSSKWTRSLSVASSCRIRLNVVANEPDVNSKEEAQALIAKLEQDLANKQAEVRSYDDLLRLRDAFQFLQTFTEGYYDELTDEFVQELRVQAQSAISSLNDLSSACGGQLDDMDRDNISLLLLALPHVGRSERWSNRDGSPMTLADAMGADGDAIYNTAAKIVRENSAASQLYEAKLKQATAEAATLTHQLALAKTQLAAWLKG